MKLQDVVVSLTPAQREALARIQRDPRTRAALSAPTAVRAAPSAELVSAHARVEPDGSVVVTAKGLRLVSVLNNGGEHWATRKRRVDREHATIGGALASIDLPEGPRWTVEIIREGRALLDDDNLRASAKGTRDAIACALGVDDGPQGPVAWSYGQRKGKGYGVMVTIKGVRDGAR